MPQALLDISIIVAASALMAWLAVVLRQPMIVAYVACGILAGPSVLGLVKGTGFIDAVSQFGIILLLFHAGVVLHPRRLRELALKATAVTTIQSAASLLVVMALGLTFGQGWNASLLLGLALMFSSTILVIKLMPTVALHHQRMGAYSIAILIIQDLAAVGVLMFLGGGHPGTLVLKGGLIAGLSLAVEQWALRPAMARAERYREVLFLLAIGWGLGMAYLAHAIGFSPEAAAFMAGVALARSPLALFLSEGLKLFRDFFLVFFFFVLGARLQLSAVWPSLGLAALLVPVLMGSKYLSFTFLFRITGETAAFAREAGIRLSQASEFALIIAMAASRSDLMPPRLIQAVMVSTLLSMIISSYLVVFLYPTPLGVSGGMKQD